MTTMRRTIRLFMLAEGASFLAASLVHAGVLIPGYEHRQARIAESIIAAVLLGGAVLTWLRPASTRAVGLAAQGFALLGTLVGLFTIAVGVGPRTAPDVIYHIVIVAVLVGGLVACTRGRRGA